MMEPLYGRAEARPFPDYFALHLCVSVFICGSKSLLVPEVPDAREHHGQAQPVGCRNHLFIPH
jgi:hypothetical protein